MSTYSCFGFGPFSWSPSDLRLRFPPLCKRHAPRQDPLNPLPHPPKLPLQVIRTADESGRNCTPLTFFPPATSSAPPPPLLPLLPRPRPPAAPAVGSESSAIIRRVQASTSSSSSSHRAGVIVATVTVLACQAAQTLGVPGICSRKRQKCNNSLGTGGKPASRPCLADCPVLCPLPL